MMLCGWRLFNLDSEFVVTYVMVGCILNLKGGETR